MNNFINKTTFFRNVEDLHGSLHGRSPVRHAILILLQKLNVFRFVTITAPLCGRRCNAYLEIKRIHLEGGYLTLSLSKPDRSRRGHPPNSAPLRVRKALI